MQTEWPFAIPNFFWVHTQHSYTQSLSFEGLCWPNTMQHCMPLLRAASILAARTFRSGKQTFVLNKYVLTVVASSNSNSTFTLSPSHFNVMLGRKLAVSQ